MKSHTLTNEFGIDDPNFLHHKYENNQPTQRTEHDYKDHKNSIIKKRFTVDLINSDTIASALHCPREDDNGREKYKDIVFKDIQGIEIDKQNKTRGYFTEREIINSNSSHEEDIYRDKIKKMADMRQIRPESLKKGANYLSTKKIMNHNDCGVATLLHPTSCEKFSKQGIATKFAPGRSASPEKLIRSTQVDCRVVEEALHH